MKRAAWLIPLALGLAVLLLSGCGNEVNLTLKNGKIVLYPNPGDVINWKGGVSVHFYGPPLCTDTSSKFLTSCTVAKLPNVNAPARFYYVCDPQHPCSDPEVDMGSGSLLGVQGGPAVVNDGVGVQCTSGQYQLIPTQLPDPEFQPGALVAGSTVQWHSIGNPPATDWAVTFAATNLTVCGVDPIVEGTTCTIQKGLTAQTNYPYSVASTSTAKQCAGAGNGALMTP